jgi:hypothetical protein
MFFALRDSRGTVLYPDYEGAIWLKSENSQLLRLELRATHLPRGFGWASVEVLIDYGDVPIRGLGAFLLPSRSETNACNRRNSSTNVVVFEDCRKFATRSRILTDIPPN